MATVKEDYETGDKKAILREVIRFIKAKCPKWHFTLADKDPDEIGACQEEHAEGKHQNCYWHGVHYVQEWLSEDKPPAVYSPLRAHLQFKFIDPTWAPGVSSGSCEDDVDPKGVENISGTKNIVRIPHQDKRSKLTLPILAITVNDTKYMLTTCAHCEQRQPETTDLASATEGR